MKKISIIVPMYNEQEAAPYFFEALDKVINEIKGYEFEIVAVNDGSKDDTLNILKAEFEKRSNLVVVNLSRNWGHESAVRAGFINCTGDCAIPMDADLQDPPEVIPSMIEMWEKGYKVVNAKRSSRKNDTSFKRNTAGLYYKILNKFGKKVKIAQNVANFRLIDRRVIDEVNALPEGTRVFRVEVPFVGFKTCEVEFIRPERVKGETKYPLKSMVNLAIDSIVSLSVEPLKFPIKIGVGFGALAGLSCLTELVFFILNLCKVTNISSTTLWGWLIASLVVGFFATTMLVLGLFGIYLGETVNETRGRPTVIVDEVFRK